jgi:hypothetical protein
MPFEMSAGKYRLQAFNQLLIATEITNGKQIF